MAKKFYACRTTQEIFTSWGECASVVTGLKGAEFKGFSDIDQAKTWLKQGVRTPKIPNFEPKESVKYEYCNKNGIHGNIIIARTANPFSFNTKGHKIFIDGSYNRKNKTYGAGVVVMDATGKIHHKIKAADNKKELAHFCNVSGEVLAFAKAMSLAVQNNWNSISIICDLKTIYEWGCGLLPTQTTPVSRHFQIAMDFAALSGVKHIDFVWIKGHSGISGNTHADNLAKKACGVK